MKVFIISTLVAFGLWGCETVVDHENYVAEEPDLIPYCETAFSTNPALLTIEIDSFILFLPAEFRFLDADSLHRTLIGCNTKYDYVLSDVKGQLLEVYRQKIPDNFHREVSIYRSSHYYSENLPKMFTGSQVIDVCHINKNFTRMIFSDNGYPKFILNMAFQGPSSYVTFSYRTYQLDDILTKLPEFYIVAKN